MVKRINLLWTGGFDSTFRLCQLSRMENVEVQPIYCIFPQDQRPNKFREMEAQDTILQMVRARPETKAEILDPVRLTPNDLPPDPDYDLAFCRHFTADEPAVSGQLRALGKVPLLYPNAEFCIEARFPQRVTKDQPHGKTRTYMEDHGFRFKEHPDGSVSYDASKADPDTRLLFGRFSYPVLLIPEIKMLSFIRQWKYEEIFQHTWTCDFNQEVPCGICHQCQVKWDSGLAEILPPSAHRNHQILSSLREDGIPDSTRKYLLIGPTDIAAAFRSYVMNGYKVLNPFSVLSMPSNTQSFVYERICQRTERLQQFFDSLVQDRPVKEAAPHAPKA